MTTKQVRRVSGESVSLSTTRLYRPLPSWALEAFFYTPAEARLLVSPDLLDAILDSSSLKPAVLFDDGSSATVGGGTYLYLLSNYKFSGFYAEVTTPNTVSASMTVEYWDGSAWTAVSGLSDGTASVGATLATSGEVSWTVPSDWERRTIQNRPGVFVVRISFSAAITTTTAVDFIQLRPEEVSGIYVAPGQVGFDMKGAGGLVLYLDSGTATGEVNWIGYIG